MFKDIININKLCGPAYIYLVFSTFIFMFLLARMITTGKLNFSNILVRLAVTYIVTFTLNWLCVKGWSKFAWFLLVWMFMFILILLIGTFVLANKVMSDPKFVSLNSLSNLTKP